VKGDISATARLCAAEVSLRGNAGRGDELENRAASSVASTVEIVGVFRKSARTGGHLMSNVYKIIELVGSSEKSIEDAIEIAIKRADQTVRNLRWFEVIQTRGRIEHGAVKDYQVVLKAGFTLDGGDS
jgi:hypothetical protein